MATAIATSGHAALVGERGVLPVGGALCGRPGDASRCCSASQPAVLFAVCTALTVGLMLGGDFVAVVFALVSGLAGALVAPRFTGRSTFTRLGLLVGARQRRHGRRPGAVPGPAGAARGPGVGGGMRLRRAVRWRSVWRASCCRCSRRLFGMTTDIRLLELSNPNLPLLKRLSLEAPGTFQHSLAIGNLAEAGGRGGRRQRAAGCGCAATTTTSASWLKPEYFVENQRGANPHDNLSPWMSALVVSNHVKAGLELARQYKLPQPIREAIATHHGTKLIRYFFTRAKEQANGGQRRGRGGRVPLPGAEAALQGDGHPAARRRGRGGGRTLQDPTPAKHPGDDRPDHHEHPGGRAARRLRADLQGASRRSRRRSSGC